MRVKLEIKMPRCPICGSYPLMEKKSLEKENGRGYVGEYSFQLYCPVCDLPKADEAHTLYKAEQDAINNAKEYWKKEVDRIQGHLDRKEK